MGDLNRGSGLPLWSDHTDFVRRHRLVMAALTGVGLAAGGLWTLQQPSTFSSRASVALASVPVYVMTTTDDVVPPEVSIDTDAQLLRSARVLDAVGEELGTNRQQSAERLSITASANTHVLHVTVSADSPDQAAAAANAAAETLAGVRRSALGALQEDQHRHLRMLLGNHRRQLHDRLDAENESLLLTTDEDQFAQVLDARASLDELEEARANPAEVVRPAVPPQEADYANAEVPLVSGAMLGLLGACLLGAARDRMRPRGSPPGEPTPEPAQHRRTIRPTDHEDTRHAG